MKAILEFDLEEQGDIEQHLRCVKSNDMACFIWELTHNMWRTWKHNEDDLNVDTLKEEINHLLEEYNINPDDLWK